MRHHPEKAAGAKSGFRGRAAPLLAAIAGLALGAAACTSPEQRLERYLKSGGDYLEEERLGLANVQYLNALKIDEDNVAALTGLSKIAEKKGDYERMFGILQQISRIDPANERARLDLAKLHLLANDAKSSLEIIDKILESSPQNAEALAVKSAVMFRLGNNAEAIDFARKALAIDPVSQEATAVLASERVNDKDFEGALKILDGALARSARAPVLHLLRVQVLGHLGRTDDVNAAYQGLIKEYPDDENYRRLYATSLIAQNRLAEARAELVEVARILPKRLEAKLDIVRIDYRIGGKAKAEETLRAMIAETNDDSDLKFALGAFLREEKDFARAEEVYQSIMAKKGAEMDNILRAKNEIAAIRMLEGKRPEAEKLIAEVLAADAKNPDALVKRAGLRIDDGSIDDAIGDLRVVVNEHGENVAARLLLAAAFEQKGDVNLAESEMAQAVETSNRASQPSFLFAKFLLRQGKPDRAEKVLAESIAADPAAADSLKLLAAIRLDRQDWRGAEEAANALKSVSSADGDVSRILGAAYAGLKDYAGAIDVLTQEHERAPLASRPLSTLVGAYVDAGRTEDAEKFLADTVAKNPSHYEARVLLAQIKRALKKSKEATEILAAAIELDPLRPEAYEATYGVYVLDGRRDDAGKLIEQATAAIPDNDGLQILKADHLIAIGEPDAAIAIYETILARRPDDRIVANNLASLLLEKQDQASVARAAAAAEALKGLENPYFLDTYGWALYRSGRVEEGIKALEKAAAAAPGLVDARYHLGVALMESGDRERGEAELSAVIAAPGADARRVADAQRRLAGD
ncbi:MAG: tetratricopeptide repeat protein [Parvularculaceae bacterium]|nr:tetratricopeptide repeat protein [Parvularculaceae bacterium]